MVSITPSYPTTTPVFSLSLQLDGNTETQETCEMMRVLEREVKLGKEQATGGTSSYFIKSKVLFDSVKGKMRRLRLYNSSQQLFQQRYFVQIVK